jgi:hypothetical protein
VLRSNGTSRKLIGIDCSRDGAAQEDVLTEQGLFDTGIAMPL